MRKIIRSMLRAKAEDMGVKPSRYVSREFDSYQVKKYGRIRRRICQAIGTHKRKVWRSRIEAVV